jgi:hypothetical protein
MRMAGEGTKRPRGRPPGKSERSQVTFSLPKDDFAYLQMLVGEKKRLGNSVNDAARQILVREVYEMRRTEFHKKD